MINIHKISVFIVSLLLFIILRDEMISIVENSLFADVSNSTVSRIYYVLLFLVAFGYIAFYSIVNIRKGFINSLLLLFFCVYVLSFFHTVFVPFSSSAYYLILILPVLIVLFMINATFYISEESFFEKIFFIFFALLVFYYFKTYDIRSQFQGELTSSSAYVILYFLPFLLCIRNKSIKFISVIVAVIALLFSYKRGGIIALGLALSIYWLIVNYINEFNNNKTICAFILLAILLIAFYYIFLNIESEGDNILMKRFQNISEDKGSGRLDVYIYTWDMITNSNVIGIIFGHGWNGVLRDSSLKLSAHNDLLEIIYDFGAIVAILYLNTIFKLFQYAKMLIKERSFYAAPFTASLVIFLFNSTISHIFIYSNYLIVFVMFWSYVYVKNIQGNPVKSDR